MNKLFPLCLVVCLCLTLLPAIRAVELDVQVQASQMDRVQRLPLELAEVLPLSAEELLSLADDDTPSLSSHAVPSSHDEHFQHIQTSFNEITSESRIKQQAKQEEDLAQQLHEEEERLRQVTMQLQQAKDEQAQFERAHSHLEAHSQAEVEGEVEAEQEGELEAEADAESESEEGEGEGKRSLLERGKKKGKKAGKGKGKKASKGKKGKKGGKKSRKGKGKKKGGKRKGKGKGKKPRKFKGKGKKKNDDSYPAWQRAAGMRRRPKVTTQGNADKLNQRDTKCVICQYIVQRARTDLTGKNWGPGPGITPEKIAEAKAQRAADHKAGEAMARTSLAALSSKARQLPTPPQPKSAAPLPPVSNTPASHVDDAPSAVFLETESLLDMEMEVDADLSMSADMSATELIALELENTLDLQGQVNTWLAASDAAAQHTATDAMNTYYGEYFGRTTPRWPNVAPNTYPPNLMDRGMEAPRRYRGNGILGYRPIRGRIGNKELDAKKEEARAKMRETYTKLYTGVYQTVEDLCSKRMPLAYVGYCKDILQEYRFVAQGLQYGDRPEAVCMNANFCSKRSYIRYTPHMFFTKQNGDSDFY